MKIALLTSPNQWFIPYAKAFSQKHGIALFLETKELRNFDIVFILSYHKILDKNFLKQNKHNLVVHGSSLPQGKGFAPLFHQVIEGKNEIVFTLFEADEKVDAGGIYLQKTLYLNGLELYEELREKQAKITLELCSEFLQNHANLKAQAQSGKESFYPKRSPKDSELDINKSIKQQFNLLRICSNEEFPAFFYKDGKKFILKIYTDVGGGILTFKNFIHLSKKEKEKIRLFRNHEKIKEYMFHQHFITKGEHKNFILSLKRNSKKVHFVLFYKGQILGTLYFKELEKDSLEFGFYSNPYPSFIGLGLIFEKISLFYAFCFKGTKNLCCEVFEENAAVVKLHKKFGFQITNSYDFKEKRVLKMCLSL